MEERQFTFQPMTSLLLTHTPLKPRPLTSVPNLIGHTFPHLASILPSFVICPFVFFAPAAENPRKPPFLTLHDSAHAWLSEQVCMNMDQMFRRWAWTDNRPLWPVSRLCGKKKRQKFALLYVSPQKCWCRCFREQIQFNLDNGGHL